MISFNGARFGVRKPAPDAPAPQRRLYVQQVDTAWGDKQWECEAGQLDQPIGCERHRDHHWCETCLGFYGVPHDGIHEGPDAHPYWGSFREQCACRPCKQASGRA